MTANSSTDDSRPPGILREVAVTYSGQIIGSGIGMIIQLLLQKSLGTVSYGVLAMAVSAGAVAGVVTDFGISHAMVRFGSRALAEHPGDNEPAQAHMFVGLVARLALVALVSIIGLLTVNWQAITVFADPAVANPLKWVYIGLVGNTLWSYWLFYVQTFQRFGLRSALVVAVAVLRLGSFAAAWTLHVLDPTAMIIIDAAVPLVGFAIGMMLSPRGLLSVPHERWKSAARELLPYCRFTGILIIGDTIFNELDTLMLGAMADSHTVGVYRAAWTYAMAFGFLNMSVANVLFPKVTSVSDPTELRAFIRRILKFTSLLALATLPAIPLVAWWIPWYEKSYSDATGIFYLLYLGILFELVIGPLQYALYSLNRPGILAAIALIKIALNVAANVLLIPQYGAYGAAGATIFTRVFGGAVAVTIIMATLSQLEFGDKSKSQ